MESLLQDTPIHISASVEEQLIIAYGTMKRLGWVPQYAGPYRLIGFTPKKRLLANEEIMVEVTEDTIAFSSKLNFDKANWNAARKDKKNVKALQEAYEQTQKEATPE